MVLGASYMVGDLVCDAAGAISISMVRCRPTVYTPISLREDCTTLYKAW